MLTMTDVLKEGESRGYLTALLVVMCIHGDRKLEFKFADPLPVPGPWPENTPIPTSDAFRAEILVGLFNLPGDGHIFPLNATMTVEFEYQVNGELMEAFVSLGFNGDNPVPTDCLITNWSSNHG